MRRRVIEERYKSLIEAIYSNAEEAEVTVSMRLEDGRTVTVTRRVKIVAVE